MAATIVYDSTGQAAAGADTSVEHSHRTAFSFTASSSFAGTLTDVKIDLGDATPGDGGTITAYLYSDSGGSGPGTQLATLGTIADSSLSSTFSLVDFPISSTIDLTAGTRYWIELSDSSTSAAYVEYDSTDAGTGVASEFYWDGGPATYPNSNGGADIAQVTETLNSADLVPVVTPSSGAAAFVAGAGAVAVDSGINVTDADNGTLASATVAITGNFQAGQDVLSFTSSVAFGNIVGSYNSATGVLSLTSAGDTATVQQFKAALEAVTYSDTAATPDTLTRTLSFTADDGIGPSLTATRQLTVMDSAQGRIVYDNTTQAATGTDTTFEQGAYNSAFSFTSYAATPGMLADLKIDLGDATPGDGGTVTAYLYSDTGGSGPGTLLATIGTISDSSLGTSASFADFAISSTINLDAGTRYWIQLTDSAQSGAFLGYDNSDVGTGVAGEYYTYQGVAYANSASPGSASDLAQIIENSTSADQPPVVTTSLGDDAFVAGKGPVAVDSGINVTDADNATLASATVAITGNFQSGEDVLAFTNTSAVAFGNITSGYNSGTGVLTLTSAGDTATVAQFKSALEAVTYTDTAATPDSLTRTVSFTADDAITNSLTATKQITVADSGQSQLVYDNSSQAATGSDTTFEQGAYNSAFSFTSFSAAAGTLADLKIDLGDANPGDGGTVTAYLYSDTGGSGPGAMLATIGTISDSSLGTTPSFTDFAISSTINLDAGTRYWVQFTDSANSGAFLAYDGSAAGTGVAGEYYTYQGVVKSNSTGSDLAQVTEDATCFCTGTRILTNRGEVAVEQLRVGDKAVTASGEMRPIKWIGRREVNCRAQRDPRTVWPVRIVADAFGPGKPRRDLFLSPGHAVCVDLLGEVLIGASALVNGGSIARIETDEVTYWHVELDSHDILIANGLPAESYMDCGNRGWFTGGQGEVDANRDIGSPASYCRPFHNSGALVEVCRDQLRRRAEAIGWRGSRDMDLHLLADGRRIEAEIEGDRARFLIPKGAAEVWLASETFVPAWRAGSDDRRLGVCLLDLNVSDGLGLDQKIALDHPLLGDGLHAMESGGRGNGWRWTDGRCRLPAQLWAEGEADLTLSVRCVENSPGWRWIAPATAQFQAANIVKFRVA